MLQTLIPEVIDCVMHDETIGSEDTMGNTDSVLLNVYRTCDFSGRRFVVVAVAMPNYWRGNPPAESPRAMMKRHDNAPARSKYHKFEELTSPCVDAFDVRV